MLGLQGCQCGAGVVFEDARGSEQGRGDAALCGHVASAPSRAMGSAGWVLDCDGKGRELSLQGCLTWALPTHCQAPWTRLATCTVKVWLPRSTAGPISYTG